MIHIRPLPVPCRSVVQRVNRLAVEYLRQDGIHFTADAALAGDWPDAEADALAREHHAIAAPKGSRPRKLQPARTTRNFFGNE